MYYDFQAKIPMLISHTNVPLKIENQNNYSNQLSLTSPVKTTGFFIISHVIGQIKFNGTEKSFAIIHNILL
jgi:hypothetical protein